MTIAGARFDHRSGFDLEIEPGEGARGTNVLCVAFDPKAARAAVPRSAEHALILGGSVLVLAAFTSAYACAGPIATCWGMPALDPAAVVSSEIADLAGGRGANVRTVWVPDWRRAPDAAAAALGEGTYSVAYVAAACGRRGTREAGRVLARAARYCTAIDVEVESGVAGRS